MTDTESEFDGIGPDGEPTKLRFAEGRWYVHLCLGCGGSNGGGVENGRHKPGMPDDPYSPINMPCVWCDGGPMVVKYLDDDTDALAH